MIDETRKKSFRNNFSKVWTKNHVKSEKKSKPSGKNVVNMAKRAVTIKNPMKLVKNWLSSTKSPSPSAKADIPKTKIWKRLLLFLVCSKSKHEDQNHHHWEIVGPLVHREKTRAPPQVLHPTSNSHLAPSLAGILVLAYIIDHRDRLRRVVWLAKRLHLWGMVQVKLRVILGLYAVSQILRVILRRQQSRRQHPATA